MNLRSGHATTSSSVVHVKTKRAKRKPAIYVYWTHLRIEINSAWIYRPLIRQLLSTPLPDDNYVISRSASPDGTKLIIKQRLKRELCVVDSTTGNVLSRLPVFVACEDCNLSISWSPCGAMVVGIVYGHIIIWNVLTGCVIDRFDVEFGVENICCNPQGRFIALSATDGFIKILDTSLERERIPYETCVQHGWSPGIQALSWRPDGKVLAIGSDCVNASILLWAFQTDTDPVSISLNYTNITDCLTLDLAWHPAGSILVSVIENGDAYIWDTHTRSMLYALHGCNGIQAVSWHPDGTSLTCLVHNASSCDEICIWNMKTAEFSRGCLLGGLSTCEIKNNGHLFVYTRVNYCDTHVYIFEEALSPDASKTVEKALDDRFGCKDAAKIVLSFF